MLLVPPAMKTPETSEGLRWERDKASSTQRMERSKIGLAAAMNSSWVMVSLTMPCLVEKISTGLLVSALSCSFTASAWTTLKPASSTVKASPVLARNLAWIKS